jgi:hypothetical protein
MCCVQVIDVTSAGGVAVLTCVLCLRHAAFTAAAAAGCREYTGYREEVGTLPDGRHFKVRPDTALEAAATTARRHFKVGLHYAAVATRSCTGYGLYRRIM